MKVPTRAVIPVAGLATRMQPLCRSIPKEMLPLGRRPVIHHAVEELHRGGAKDFLLVTGPRSSAIENYFSPNAPLDDELDRKGIPTGWYHGEKSLADCSFQSVIQRVPKSVSDAVYHAREFVDSQPFFLHMGDSVITGDDDYASRMVEAMTKYQASAVVLVHNMVLEDLCLHGVASTQRELEAGIFEIEYVIENPTPTEVTRTLGCAGRYLISARMIDTPLEEEPRIAPMGNLSAIFSSEGELAGPVIAVATKDSAKLYDTGTLNGYLEAMVAFALQDAEMGESLRARCRATTT